jgi:hypothetical protein
MIAAALLGKEVHVCASNYHKVPALAASWLQDYSISFEPDLRESLTKELKMKGANTHSVSTGAGEIASPRSEFEELRALADERGRLLDEVFSSKVFRLASLYWRLRRYLSKR